MLHWGIVVAAAFADYHAMRVYLMHTVAITWMAFLARLST